MGKRGRPARQMPAQTVPPVEAEKRKIDDSHIEILPDRVFDSGLVSDNAVDDMYDKFEDHRIENSEEQAENTAPDTVVNQEVPPVKEQETEIPPAEEKSQKASIKEPDVYVKETPQQRVEKFERTVPLAALHEARDEIKELKRRLSDVEHKEPSPETDAFNGNAEYEYVTKKDFQSMQQKLDVIEREKVQQKMQNNISLANESLSQEGFFGFKDYGITIVGKILNELYLEDPTYAMAHDNPEGWMKIWREEYPKFKKAFVEKDVQRVMQEKIERKQNAQMIANPGLKTEDNVQPETTKPLTREESMLEYSRERKAGLL